MTTPLSARAHDGRRRALSGARAAPARRVLPGRARRAPRPPARRRFEREGVVAARRAHSGCAGDASRAGRRRRDVAGSHRGATSGRSRAATEARAARSNGARPPRGRGRGIRRRRGARRARSVAMAPTQRSHGWSTAGRTAGRFGGRSAAPWRARRPRGSTAAPGCIAGTGDRAPSARREARARDRRRPGRARGGVAPARRPRSNGRWPRSHRPSRCPSRRARAGAGRHAGPCRHREGEGCAGDERGACPTVSATLGAIVAATTTATIAAPIGRAASARPPEQRDDECRATAATTAGVSDGEVELGVGGRMRWSPASDQGDAVAARPKDRCGAEGGAGRLRGPRRSPTRRTRMRRRAGARRGSASRRRRCGGAVAPPARGHRVAEVELERRTRGRGQRGVTPSATAATTDQRGRRAAAAAGP